MFATLLATVGYLVAPLLFQTLDQVTAGSIVGQLLNISNWIVLTGLLSLLVIRLFGMKQLILNWVLLICVGILVFIQYWLSPVMESIKLASPEGLTKASEAWPAFAMWHGVYQLLFLLLILLLLTWSMANAKSLIRMEKKGNKKSL